MQAANQTRATNIILPFPIHLLEPQRVFRALSFIRTLNLPDAISGAQIGIFGSGLVFDFYQGF